MFLVTFSFYPLFVLSFCLPLIFYFISFYSGISGQIFHLSLFTSLHILYNIFFCLFASFHSSFFFHFFPLPSIFPFTPSPPSESGPSLMSSMAAQSETFPLFSLPSSLSLLPFLPLSPPHLPSLSSFPCLSLPHLLTLALPLISPLSSPFLLCLSCPLRSTFFSFNPLYVPLSQVFNSLAKVTWCLLLLLYRLKSLIYSVTLFFPFSPSYTCSSSLSSPLPLLYSLLRAPGSNYTRGAVFS